MKITKGQHITGSNIPPGGYYEDDEFELEISDIEVIKDRIIDNVATYEMDLDENVDRELVKAKYQKMAEENPEKFIEKIDGWIDDNIVDFEIDIFEPLN